MFETQSRSYIFKMNFEHYEENIKVMTQLKNISSLFLCCVVIIEVHNLGRYIGMMMCHD